MLSLIRPSFFLSLFTVAVVALVPQFTNCFTITPTSTSTSIHRIQSRTHSQSTTKIYLTSEQDDDIQKQLAKAKKLIEEAKAKVAAQEAAAAQVQEETEADAETDTEVTASQDENENEDESEKNKESVIKSRNEETGLITTDGELMAELSELDEWEVKSLMDVFESESTNGRHDDTGKSIADRDVAASIFNLRMKMMDKDYRRIFDKRNFFIGEDN